MAHTSAFIITEDGKNVSLMLQTTVIFYNKHLALSHKWPFIEQLTHPR